MSNIWICIFVLVIIAGSHDSAEWNKRTSDVLSSLERHQTSQSWPANDVVHSKFERGKRCLINHLHVFSSLDNC